MAEEKIFKKYDTFAETTYLVRLAQDAKVFDRTDGGEDIVLTFCDNSRVETTEDMWVDARLARFQNERGKLLRKGDDIQVRGKLRFKKQDDGSYRGKIYDAVFNSFVILRDRAAPVKVDAKPMFE